MRMTTKFRQLLASDRIAWTAAAYDGLTAKLVAEAGFDAVVAAGFQISASMGLPDAELYTMTENLAATRNIVRASGIPVMADIDTGYGNAINVMRTVREFEQAGVASVQIEDQVAPKTCPAMGEGEMISLEEGVGKIKAAVAARSDPDLVISARTDATSVEEACVRLKAYAAAGADMVFVVNKCVKKFEDLQRIREAAGVPIKLHLMGWVEKLSDAQIRQVSNCVGWAWPTLMTVTESLRCNLSALRESRSAENLPLKQTSLGDFKKFIGFPEIERLQSLYLPQDNPRLKH
jgi:2-methylisocitrate lyase-like PEP mutase family enzyme